ncbi:MAG: hypothetical protein EOP11_20115 [Proteobacteria bacterium]|nr:MAG: hypothetical protein EOP11_20115 [Pseudomonadota bacterium]
MHYVALGFLVLLAIGEYALTGRLSFGGCALVFVALRLQAERAADNFARYGKEGPPPPPWQQAMPPEEEDPEDLESWLPPNYGQAGPEIKVAPLRGGQAKQKHYYGPAPGPEAAPGRDLAA